MGANHTHTPSAATSVAEPTPEETFGEALDSAGRGLEFEIFRNGKHHREVAEAHDVSIDAIVWLMKRFGIGFAGQDPGQPPEDVEAAVEALQGNWVRQRLTSPRRYV